MYMKIGDLFNLFVKVFVIVMFIIIFCCLIKLNYFLVLSFCKNVCIPFDFTLSILSIGFGYELIMMMFVLEVLLIYISLMRVFSVDK